MGLARRKKGLSIGRHRTIGDALIIEGIPYLLKLREQNVFLGLGNARR